MQLEKSARALLIVTALAWSIPYAQHASSAGLKDVNNGFATRK